jgi:hypothetical protein
MKRFNKFLYGFIPGLLLPVGFMWIYLNRFYPVDLSFFETIKQLHVNKMLGSVLMLSVIPNLILTFVFYKSDSFKIATGILLSGMLYFIASIFLS